MSMELTEEQKEAVQRVKLILAERFNKFSIQDYSEITKDFLQETKKVNERVAASAASDEGMKIKFDAFALG